MQQSLTYKNCISKLKRGASSRCLKITGKVSFNIASKASYVFILSGHFIKNGLRSNSVTRQVNINRTKIGGKCQNSKIEMRHFEYFSNNVEAPKNCLGLKPVVHSVQKNSYFPTLQFLEVAPQ